MRLFCGIVLSLVAVISNAYAEKTGRDGERANIISNETNIANGNKTEYTFIEMRVTDEVRLHNELFHKHKKFHSHPTTDALVVTLGFTLVSIVDIDASSEAIVINAYIRQGWKNPMIRWNPADYGNITRINVRPEKTWLPDIYAYGNIQFSYLYDTLLTHIIVNFDGNHSWLAPVIMQIGCKMNVKDFPFDTQACPLLLGSYTYNKLMVNLTPEVINMKMYSPSSEWVFQSMDHTRKEILYPGSTTEFADVEFTVILKRKPLYFIINLLAPTMTLALLTLLAFLQPVLAGERVGYVITILLALSWFLTSAIDYLPCSCEAIPLSQVFLGISLLVIVLICICLSCSIALHYGNLGATEMPTYLRTYVLEKLGTYFGCNIKREYPLWRENLDIIKELEAGICEADSTESFDLLNYYEKLEQFCLFYRDSCSSEGSDDSLEEVLRKKDVHQLNVRLDVILQKLEQDDDNRYIEREWNALALTLDYLFVYIFASIIGLTLVYCAAFVLNLP